MASLQYSFFPTDFYYPRPQPMSADTGRAAAVTFQSQTLKKEVGDELEWPKSLGFRVHKAGSKQAGVSMRFQDQSQGKPYVEGKPVKYSGQSMVLLIPKDRSSDPS